MYLPGMVKTFQSHTRSMSRALYYALALVCATPTVRRYGFPSGNFDSGIHLNVPNVSETISTRFDIVMAPKTYRPRATCGCLVATDLSPFRSADGSMDT